MSIITVTIRDNQGLTWKITQNPTTDRWEATSSYNDDLPEASHTRGSLQESIAYIEAQQPQPVICDSCGARLIDRAGNNCGRRLGDMRHCVGTLTAEVPSPVMVVTGGPVDGFRLIGPAVPNSGDIEELTDRVLTHDTWWYLPVTSVHDALGTLNR